MDLSNNKINDFYQMNRIRYVEETIANKYSEQERRCPIHLSTNFYLVISCGRLPTNLSRLEIRSRT